MGTSCDDGDVCTVNDIYDNECNCVGTFADLDEDGVCDTNDICEGGDDNADMDSDGVPDFCDDCDNNLMGTSCDDGDVCTVNDIYDNECNCVGTFSDLDEDGVCDANDICEGGDDNMDMDSDSVPDFCDACDNNLIGTICSDGEACTINDVYDADCNCIGVYMDSDDDGICDANDICIDGDDNIDLDEDGMPDACDNCLNVIDTFEWSTLEHIGTNNSFISLTFDNRENISFKISDLTFNTEGDSSLRYIDKVTILYLDIMGVVHNYGTFNGMEKSFVDVFIEEPIQQMTINLEDSYDGEAPKISVDLSNIISCVMEPDLVSNNEIAIDWPFDVKVYPNPTTGAFNVSFNAEEGKPYELQIIDTWGRRLFNRKAQGQSGQNIIEINDIGLSAGVYYLNLTSNNIPIKTKRLVVIK